ncbi:hypothetical protein P3T37_002161 [Kitasatospora sp. MAA4]|uniref:hypothetical protein n=1 Tax=Kitasatospora sp. MAA4 TaxID=3035093 RepID=UPI0024739D31|nr:hypothetical protein [Kitasatospora sp. MAA4]MDH6132775.1 hypothetical protein [Kitasatospora sp. MAA4]
MTDQLQDALASSARRITPSPAPVTEIVRSGRALRTRRRRVRTGVAACALAGALALSWSLKDLAGTPEPPPPAAAATVPGQLSQIVGSGVLDGTTWSVTLTYYPTTPPDFVPGEKSTGSLVCLQTTLNNQPTSPYGDCAGVKGLTAPNPSGMYGQHMLPDGASIFIAQPAADVATATMNFTNTAPTTATTATIPGTAFTAYAIPIPAASHMHTLDEYDTQHHTVGHQNF